MSDIMDDLRKVEELQGDTYSSYEILAMVKHAADEIEHLREKVEILEAEIRVMRKLPATIDEIISQVGGGRRR